MGAQSTASRAWRAASLTTATVLAATALTGAPATAQMIEPFTIAVIPDTQNYTYLGRQGTIAAQAQWIVDSRSALNTVFTVHVGDLVSDYYKPEQWSHVSQGLKVLDDSAMPNTVSLGNHDFDTATGDADLFNVHFPVSRYAQGTWNSATTRYAGYMGDDQFGPDALDRQNANSFALFSAAGSDFLILNLEWEAPPPALDWARRVLAAHPDRTAILVTHSFINTSGARRTVAERPGGTSQAALWSDFVSQECAIGLVISGHETDDISGEAARTDLNSCGEPVHQLLSDYQGRPNGGDGWLRYYTFDLGQETLRATTYSPTLESYETDADSAFVLPFSTQSAEPPPAPSMTDGFDRTRTGGWGEADIGGAWSPASSPGSFSVSNSVGNIHVDRGKNRVIRSSTFSAEDLSIRATLRLSAPPTGSGTYVSILGRAGSVGEYRVTIVTTPTATTLSIRRLLGTVETVLATQRLAGLWPVGMDMRVRLEISGSDPVTLRARAWTGAIEPTTWDLSAVDNSTALNTLGGVGVAGYVSSSATSSTVVSIDDFAADSLAGSSPPPPPPNEPPTSSIATPVTVGLDVSFDGTGSTDPDGEIVNYSWNFGDGGTSTTATPTHRYATSGTYNVTLTVTDDDSAMHATSRDLTVTAPNPPPSTTAITDEFTRTQSNGWGTTTSGSEWVIGNGASRFSVSGGVGVQRLASGGSSAEANVPSITSRSWEVSTELSWDRTGRAGTIYAAIAPRAVNRNSDYRTKIIASGTTITLELLARVSGTETRLARATVPGLSLVPGASYSVLVRLSDSAAGTTLAAKIWRTGTAVPTSWAVSATDTTPALQGPGWLRVWTYASGSSTAPVTTSFDNLRVSPLPD